MRREKSALKRSVSELSDCRSEVFRAWYLAGRPKPYINEQQVGQRFSPYALFMLLLFFSFWGGFLYMVTAPSRKAKQARESFVVQAEEARGMFELRDYDGPASDVDQLVLTMQATMLPTSTVTPTLQPTMIAEATLTPTPEPTSTPLVPLNQGFGLQPIKCVNCAVYEIPVRLTHYWPDTPATAEEIERGREQQKFGNDDLITTANCWKYSISQAVCVSAMESELPWRSFIGWAAACPYDWPHGTVIHVPALGRSFWCLDRGTMVCAGGVCDVDILAPDLPQDGSVFTAVVEIPGW